LRYNIYLHLLSIILPGARPCRVGAGRGACECRGRGSWGRAAATGSAASVGHPAQSLLSAHGNGGNRALLGVAVPPARHSFSKVHYRVNFCSSDPDLCSSNRASSTTWCPYASSSASILKSHYAHIEGYLYTVDVLGHRLSRMCGLSTNSGKSVPVVAHTLDLHFPKP